MGKQQDSVRIGLKEKCPSRIAMTNKQNFFLLCDCQNNLADISFRFGFLIVNTLYGLIMMI